MSAVTDTLTVAAAQFAAVDDVAKNLDRIGELVGLAAAGGAQLVVLPEASMYSWDAPADLLLAVAQTEESGFLGALQELARMYNVVIVAGIFAESGTDKPFNRLVVVDRDGARATYDKVHLYDAFSYCESDVVLAGPICAEGSELVTVAVGAFTIGLLNCYDLRFPEMARALVDKGADVLSVSSAWVAGPHKEMHWELLLRARAVENTCYVLAACQPPPASTGLSMAVDPMGLVMGTCIGDEGVLLQTFDRRHLMKVRAVLPTLANRRYPSFRRDGPRDLERGSNANANANVPADNDSPTKEL